MSVFKCKMCGGTIEFEQGATVGVCDSCGTKQTLPRLDDERRANLYDRANHFRRANEFDKASGIYEQILNEDTSDAEAYWSIVLCRYGVEYVEDPATHKRVPTVNRAQFTSIFDDEDYKSALQYADLSQRVIYEEEAATINEIQKGILAISQKEEPFDVFICYKETDNNGRRTPDSVLANDLYHQLTNEGFKVFFSRITLEDKLGTAYEPYIFAALNSSRVMVVLGTKSEYFNAVWVKNEWSRYLSLIRGGAKKTLIPAYRDMDPYDLPEEFSHLQAQDMSKLGFMQDLIRGIRKITGADSQKEAPERTVAVNQPAAGSAAPLLKRAFMYLEDGNWSEADAYCERVLDQDPENAEAYLGKLMAELKLHKEADFEDLTETFDKSPNCEKAIRFGDETLREKLRAWNKKAPKEKTYREGVNLMKTAQTEAHFNGAARVFARIKEYKDADALHEKALARAEECGKDGIYGEAKKAMADGAGTAGLSQILSSEFDVRIYKYSAAKELFGKIPGWRDADENAAACEKAIEDLRLKKEEAEKEAARKAEEEKEARIAKEKKKKTAIMIAAPIIVAVIVFAILWMNVIAPKQKQNKAMSLLNAGDYDAAYALLTELGKEDIITESKYNRAVTLISSGDIEQAYELLNQIHYNDSEDLKAGIEKDYAATHPAMAEVGSYIKLGKFEQDNDKTNGKEDIEWLVLAKEDNRMLVISRYALFNTVFCSGYNVTLDLWENSTLRGFLNESFGDLVFSDREKAVLGSDNGKIFVLSIEEAEKYLASDEARICQRTPYADKTLVYANCTWWLRTYERSNTGAYRCSVVDANGKIKDSCIEPTLTFAVRPAMWIDLSAVD